MCHSLRTNDDTLHTISVEAVKAQPCTRAVLKLEMAISDRTMLVNNQ